MLRILGLLLLVLEINMIFPKQLGFLLLVIPIISRANFNLTLIERDLALEKEDKK